MCAIIGWAGEMPRGFLKRLIVASEVRGHDSTGICYRSEQGQNTIVKSADSPRSFVKQQANMAALQLCRKSPVGLGHTRRASRGMPINNKNAHPFSWGPYIFAHNGFIRNWQALRIELKDLAVKQNDLEAAARVASFSTDSMILGHHIASRDFSKIIGDFSLVWMRGPKVWVVKNSKDLVIVTLSWKYKESDLSDHKVTFASSTLDIAVAALEECAHIEFDVDIVEPKELSIYELTKDGPIEEEKITVAEVQKDAHSDGEKKKSDCENCEKTYDITQDEMKL